MRLALAVILVASVTGCGSGSRAQTPTVPPPRGHGVVGVDTRTVGKLTHVCLLTDVPARTGPDPARGVELCVVSESTGRVLYNTCSASAKPGIVGYLIEKHHGRTWSNAACAAASQVALDSH
jgi:hypothetical protein